MCPNWTTSFNLGLPAPQPYAARTSPILISSEHQHRDAEDHHDRQPTARLIADALEASGKTQREVAEEVGFPRGNVIRMLRAGDIRLPIERAPALARALSIDEKLLIGTAMTEYIPETWNVISDTAPDFPEIQINVKGPAPIMERFKAICAAERRTYADMMEQLMAGYDPELDRPIDKS